MKKYLLMLLLLMAAACVPSPFQATWYLVRDGADNTSTMHVVVLNRGSERQFVENVILNHATINGVETGWQLNGPGRYLDPGEVVSRPVTSFTAISQGTPTAQTWECRVPMRVDVIMDGRKSRPAEMSGVMPNRLIEDWEKGCPRK
jgi:hypothetical protein